MSLRIARGTTHFIINSHSSLHPLWFEWAMALEDFQFDKNEMFANRIGNKGCLQMADT